MCLLLKNGMLDSDFMRIIEGGVNVPIIKELTIDKINLVMIS